MNQKQITDEVKRLAKEIAKYWRMEIYEGCWVYDNQGEQCVLIEREVEIILDGSLLIYSVFVKSDTTEVMDQCRSTEWFPIPDIGDCLEKLRELKLRYIFHAWELDDILVSLIDDEKGDVIVDQMKATALHESLLQALLSVLKEEK